MGTKEILIIVVVTLVLGFGIGYLTGTRNVKSNQSAMSHQMPGEEASMSVSLVGKTGPELERAFIDGMIIHHEGAIEMAEMLLRGTARPELIKLGNDIITAQTDEIKTMKQWRSEWFGN